MKERSEVDQLRAIIRVQSEIATSDLDLDAALDLILLQAQQLTGAGSALIEMPDGAGELVCRATGGGAGPYLGRRVALESGFSGRALREGRVLRSDDTSSDPRVDQRLSRKLDARSLLCVPLRHREETIGVLKIYATGRDHFDAADTSALGLLAEVIAARISQARLFAAEAHGSRHDGLTGLLNRRSYEERLRVEAARAGRYGYPLSLALFDLDGFKAVNDAFGHPAGDAVLRDLGALIGRSRAADEVFRIGGDEFAVLMPQTSREEAEGVAARLVEGVGAKALAGVEVEISYGVADAPAEPVSLHAAADRALLAAKAQLYARQ